MNELIIKELSKELNVQVKQINNTLSLLEDGCTVPFIARYRKEMTNGLDEEQIRTIQESYNYQVNLASKKEETIKKIETLGRLTDEIVKQINKCTKLSQIEDIYLPYKQKKKTRASIAIEAGLEPLSKLILKCPRTFNEKELDQYINEKVKSREEALQMAKDIIAGQLSEDMDVREKVLDSMENFGRIVTTIKKDAQDEKKTYQMYYDYSEKVSTLASHRIMAIDRAEKEKVIGVSIEINDDYILNWLSRKMIKFQNSPTAIYIKEAIDDSYKRLIYPSCERRIRTQLSEKAHVQSIDNFSMNLEKLLCQPPMKDKIILGFDPAFRTGCKLAIIDASGKKLCVDVIYPHQPNARIPEAKRKLIQLVKDYNVDLIAIGNGTASRESEEFVAKVIQEAKLNVSYTIVSEAGASVYSASKLAIEEFPDLHVEQRSAISIARRLMDPLSELIKIDPQSIGVGQYQHDLPTNQLKQRLDFVVEKVVNRVGVNINTASVSLLKNVSGLNESMAKSIVSYREENGKITSRKEIHKIPKIGKKSFEQSAGFLRIEDGVNPLDRTGIHPESYDLTYKILQECHLSLDDVVENTVKDKIENINREELAKKLNCDMFTLNDIIDTLMMPLRDYRDQNDAPILRKDILKIEDLHENDQLEGVVRNVVDFGAFVDIGLHDDGLIHISKMSKKRIKHPSEVLQVGDVIKVWVYKVDLEREKVQLTLV